MAHGHAHHHTGDERRLGIFTLLSGGFMLAGGLIWGPLALLADAGHLLTDFASLKLAWGAAPLARRAADWKRTYGFDRFSVLAAFVTPEDQDVREVEADRSRLRGVDRVHHLYVWSISEKRPMVTLQARPAPGADAEVVRRTLRERLDREHGIGHATIEIEPAETEEHK